MIVGFGIFVMVKNWAHIMNMGVAPGYRRRGLGRRIMLHMLTMAKRQHARYSWLEVRSTNYPAINLYRKLGFRKKTGAQELLLDAIRCIERYRDDTATAGTLVGLSIHCIHDTKQLLMDELNDDIVKQKLFCYWSRVQAATIKPKPERYCFH
jgi:predicted acetyltransferase